MINPIKLSKALPKVEKSKKNFKQTNLICSCKRKIFDTDTYYIRLEPGEQPEVFCEGCISID